MKWVVQGSSSSHEIEVVRAGDGFEVIIDGRRRRVDMVRMNDFEASLRMIDNGQSYYLAFQPSSNRRWRVAVRDRELDLRVMSPLEAQVGEATAAVGGPSQIDAPIPGKVVAVKVSPGDQVEAGQALVVLEAMKMENELAAESSGTVTKVHVVPGDTVATGAPLVELE